MKPFKAAAVVAGSLALAGVAAPAVAQDASDLTPSSLNGALDTLTHQQTLDVSPVRHQSDALDTENENSVLHSVKGAAATLNRGGGPARLLGGLPLQQG
ncbi:hypothetical protein [Streptomyces sp. NPDC007264]|uniref:hypothetical protein n=1 Tax=Streptomyces sp. NPDC007264 TaxID=3364777 RepID=UPI0036DE110D